MPSILWSESSPAGGDSISEGDNAIRSLKTSVRVGLDGEHVWPSGGGDAGVHRLGSGRPHYGLQSAVSSTGTDGRLMQTSDTSRLFGVGSGGTTLIGGPTVLLGGSFPDTVPQRHYWAMEFGAGSTNASDGSGSVVFPNSGFSGRPHVTITPLSNTVQVNATLKTVNTVQMVVHTINATSDASVGVTFFYHSIGTRVL